MTPARFIRQPYLWFFLVLAWTAHAENAPRIEELTRCAKISAPEARLSCYDALSGHLAGVPAAPAAPAAPDPAQANDASQFGLSAVQRHVALIGPNQQAGRIVSMAANQPGHSTIVLDSGQTWAVLDDDGWLSSGQQVIIKRASLGSFLLTTPSHHQYRVHRLQ